MEGLEDGARTPEASRITLHCAELEDICWCEGHKAVLKDAPRALRNQRCAGVPEGQTVGKALRSTEGGSREVPWKAGGPLLLIQPGLPQIFSERGYF